MRHENPHDPRRVLCTTKLFGMRPRPLQAYLYRLKLPACAERVFWVHWDEGAHQGDFCSEIPIQEVAERVCFDVSSVTRAYQRLRHLGLLRRQDPGRDPDNPHRQLTPVTEVLLPAHAVDEFLRAPSRSTASPRNRSEPSVAAIPSAGSMAADAPVSLPMVAEAHQDWTEVQAKLRERYASRAGQRIPERMSPAERTQWFEVTRGNLKSIQLDPNTALDELEQAWVHHMAARLGRPAPAAPRPGIASPAAVPRVLQSFLLASLRKRLSTLVCADDLELRFREIVWSAEKGALKTFSPEHAVNIALKKVREGVWTKPKRMPPNWRRTVA